MILFVDGEKTSTPLDEVLPFVSIDANQSLALHPAALNAPAGAGAVCVLAMAGIWCATAVVAQHVHGVPPLGVADAGVRSPFEACHDPTRAAAAR